MATSGNNELNACMLLCTILTVLTIRTKYYMKWICEYVLLYSRRSYVITPYEIFHDKLISNFFSYSTKNLFFIILSFGLIFFCWL